MLPNHRGWAYPPGRVVRRRELTGVLAAIERLRLGLRPATRRMLSPIDGPVGVSVTFPGATGLARIGTIGDVVDFTMPWLYIGDQILDFGVSAQGAGTQPLTCQLLRYAWGVTAAEVLASFVHVPLKPGGANDVTLQGVPGMAPVRIEEGYLYRLRVTGGNVNDDVTGAFVVSDHPEV